MNDKEYRFVAKSWRKFWKELYCEFKFLMLLATVLLIMLGAGFAILSQ